MGAAKTHGWAVSVRGGGHSPFCTKDDAVLLDMSAHFNDAHLDDATIVAGAGATMGDILQAGAAEHRVVPVGKFGTPGMGLALQGGVGSLARKFGLTIDHLAEIELVLPSGDIRILSPESTGDDAELWWGSRGAGPNFGVVTSAKFRTHVLESVLSVQRLTTMSRLSAVLNWAAGGGPEVTTSLILGSLSGGEPALLVDVVSTQSGSGRADLNRDLSEVVGVEAPPSFEFESSCAHADLPPFLLPDIRGAKTPPKDVMSGVYVRCPMLRAEFDFTEVADIFSAALSNAPTANCWIEMQQMGGAVAEVERTATAFWNRNSSWSVPITAGWSSPGDRGACEEWVRDTERALESFISGYYSVEARPGTDQTAADVDAAFGDNISRLSNLKRSVDPSNILRCYYPF